MKIHEQLKLWLHNYIKECNTNSGQQKKYVLEEVVEELEQIIKSQKNKKIKILKQSICNHEWISDLSEQELAKNVIIDYKTNLPTDKHWHYGSKICKLCGLSSYEWYCPGNAPFHSCIYTDSEYCDNCGLPEERK
jgi:hypothetical protein